MKERLRVREDGVREKRIKAIFEEMFAGNFQQLIKDPNQDFHEAHNFQAG